MEELLNALEKKHLSYDIALRLLKSDSIFLQLTVQDIEDSVFGIFNGPFLYAVLYVVNNDYYWLFYDNKNKTFEGLYNNVDDDDYIIRMIINGVNKMSVLINKEDLSLQEKVKYASHIDISGYNLK